MLVTQSCPTVCDPTNCSPQGSSVHGVLQARILEWVAIAFPIKSEQAIFKNQLFPQWVAAAAKSLHTCLTLCDPIDGSPPGSSVPGIPQARILEWVAISFFRGSSRPRDRTQVSQIAGRCFTVWATRETQYPAENDKSRHLCSDATF